MRVHSPLSRFAVVTVLRNILNIMLAEHLNTKLQSFCLQSLLNIKFIPSGSLQNTIYIWFINGNHLKLQVYMEDITAENPCRLRMWKVFIVEFDFKCEFLH